MLEWGIPIKQWYLMPRQERVASVTIVVARKLIDYAMSGAK